MWKTEHIHEQKQPKKKKKYSEIVFPVPRLFTKSMLIWVEGPPFVHLRDTSCKLQVSFCI